MQVNNCVHSSRTADIIPKTIISKIQNGRFVPPIPEEDVEDSSWRVSDLDQWAEDHPSIGITVWAVQVLGKGLTEWIEVDRKDSKRAAVRIAEELKASLPLRAKHLRSIEKIQVCPVPALAGSISYA